MYRPLQTSVNSLVSCSLPAVLFYYCLQDCVICANQRGDAPQFWGEGASRAGLLRLAGFSYLCAEEQLSLRSPLVSWGWPKGTLRYTAQISQTRNWKWGCGAVVLVRKACSFQLKVRTAQCSPEVSGVWGGWRRNAGWAGWETFVCMSELMVLNNPILLSLCFSIEAF